MEAEEAERLRELDMAVDPESWMASRLLKHDKNLDWLKKKQNDKAKGQSMRWLPLSKSPSSQRKDGAFYKPHKTCEGGWTCIESEASFAVTLCHSKLLALFPLASSGWKL
eukprot:2882870-Amphidinium_carterae.1